MSPRWLPLLLLTAVVGCGESWPTVPLSGTVTVDGKPVERGHISFAPLEKDMGPDASAPIVNGRYELRAPKGKVRVFLQGTRETGRMITQFGKEEPEVVSVIPERYAAGIEIDTNDGSPSFALSSDPSG